MEYEYTDREPLEIDEVVEVSDETLAQVGGGVVGIWFY